MRGFNEEMYYGHILSGAEGAEASFVDSPTGGKGLSPVMPYGAGEKTLAANGVLRLIMAAFMAVMCRPDPPVFIR